MAHQHKSYIETSVLNACRAESDCSTCTEMMKFAGVDNITEELVQAGGETMISVETKICNKIWRTGELLTPWTL